MLQEGVAVGPRRRELLPWKVVPVGGHGQHPEIWLPRSHTIIATLYRELAMMTMKLIRVGLGCDVQRPATLMNIWDGEDDDFFKNISDGFKQNQATCRAVRRRRGPNHQPASCMHEEEHARGVYHAGEDKNRGSCPLLKDLWLTLFESLNGVVMKTTPPRIA